jgi:hypothetical protein
MNYSEALELLVAARPLMDGVKNNRVGWQPSEQEFEALEAINQLLEEFAYNPELLTQAGWSRADLVFFHGRLNYYYAKYPQLLVS